MFGRQTKQLKRCLEIIDQQNELLETTMQSFESVIHKYNDCIALLLECSQQRDKAEQVAEGVREVALELQCERNQLVKAVRPVLALAQPRSVN